MLVVCHKLTNDCSNAGTLHLKHLFPNIKYFNKTTKKHFQISAELLPFL